MNKTRQTLKKRQITILINSTLSLILIMTSPYNEKAYRFHAYLRDIFLFERNFI